MTIRSVTRAATAAALLVMSLGAGAQAVLVPSGSFAGDDPDGTFSAFGDAYGASAARAGDFLFVGTPRETAFRDGADVWDGAVYIYRKTGEDFFLAQKLTGAGNSTSGAGDRFGGGVAAAGEWLFVCAANDTDFPGLVDPRPDLFPEAFSFAGQVYVYRFDPDARVWALFQKLTAPVPGSLGQFGCRTQANHIALTSKGDVAVIGELNNFSGGIGQLHTYRFKKSTGWEHVQSIDAPLAGIDNFGDNLVFVDDKHLLAGAADIADDGSSAQGSVHLYTAMGPPGQFSPTPAQSITGDVVDPSCAALSGAPVLGEAGLAAGGGVVAIGEPCASGTAGPYTGRITVYRLIKGALEVEQVIEGDAANLFLGANFFGSADAVAVNPEGTRILAGSPVSPSGTKDPFAEGGDVRVYSSVNSAGWTLSALLSSPTPAGTIFREFGDTVYFLSDRTVFVRENNFLDPVVTGLKGQGLVYDVGP